jgi:hypothetical protein
MIGVEAGNNIVNCLLLFEDGGIHNIIPSYVPLLDVVNRSELFRPPMDTSRTQ